MHSRRATVARARPASFEVSPVALDVSPAGLEQPESVLLAPAHELAQVEGIGLPGKPAVAGEKAGQRQAFGLGGTSTP